MERLIQIFTILMKYDKNAKVAGGADEGVCVLLDPAKVSPDDLAKLIDLLVRPVYGDRCFEC